MDNQYYEGQGCVCFARNQDDCACSADWTPKEVYKLRKKVADLVQEKTNLRHRIEELTEVGNTLKQMLIDQDHYATLEHEERYIDAIELLNVGDV